VTAVTATTFGPTTAGPALDTDAKFLAHLPKIRRHARFALRHVGCPDTRADLVAETVALAWKHFARLVERGKRPERFVTTLALRCTQAVRAGRRLAGSDSSRDVLSPVARARHGFAVCLCGGGGGVLGVLAGTLAADTKGRVPEQAAFRLDFPRWRSGFRGRDRAVLDALAAGGGTCEVAGQFGLSPARVSQLRQLFRESWHEFHRSAAAG
jgi:Sigma-70 region 2